MASELVKPQLLIMEAIGTFSIVFVIGFSFLNYDLGIFSWVEIAIASFTVMVITIFVGYGISGANYNPSITISLIISKKMKPFVGAGYILSQLIGSLLAGLFLIWLATDDQLTAAVDNSELGIPKIVAGYSLLQAFLLEFLFTGALVLLYLILLKDGSTPRVFSIILALYLSLSIITIGPLTGASLNISRVFGPSIISGIFTDQWVYWLSSILSAILVGWVFSYSSKIENDLDKIDIQS